MPEANPPRPARASRRNSETAKATAPAAAPAPELPQLQPRFSEAQPTLARCLPEVAPSQLGLSAEFCDLYIFLSHLHVQSWSGYLHAQSETHQVWVLLLHGRPVAAAAERMQGGPVTVVESVTGQQALGELILAYQDGATLGAFSLPALYAQLLSSLAGTPQAFELSPAFSGVQVQSQGAVLYAGGEAVAQITVSLPYEGAFAASSPPPPLMLPRHLAGWAHASYQPTLRGKDVLSPITAAHNEFRAEFGQELALELMTALIQGLTPAEFALEHDRPLSEIEPWLSRFREQGYLVR